MTSTPATAAPQIPDADQLARYLLGELAGPEEAAIDDALSDDAVWAAVQRAEDELIDAHARGELDAARQQRLAARIAASPRLRERVELSRDLRTIGQARRRRRARGRVLAVSVAAFAVAAALVLWLAVRGGAERDTRGGTDDEQVALTLVPTTRAVAVPEVRVARHQTLALAVAIDAEDVFPRYRVRILTAGAVRWSQDDVVAVGGALALRIPVAALADGLHELELTGLGAAGAPVRLGTRGFRVLR